MFEPEGGLRFLTAVVVGGRENVSVFHRFLTYLDASINGCITLLN